MDRCFCNEEMGFANRSHPIPDGGKCLCFRAVARLKTHHCNCNLRHCILISPWLLAKVLLIEVRSISKKRRFLFLSVSDIFHPSTTPCLLLSRKVCELFCCRGSNAGKAGEPTQPNPSLDCLPAANIFAARQDMSCAWLGFIAIR